MDPAFWTALLLSFQVALLASFLLLLLGIPLAWVLAFRRFPARPCWSPSSSSPWSFLPRSWAFTSSSSWPPRGPFTASWAFPGPFALRAWSSPAWSSACPSPSPPTGRPSWPWTPTSWRWPAPWASPGRGYGPRWSFPWSGLASSRGRFSPSPRSWGSSGSSSWWGVHPRKDPGGERLPLRPGAGPALRRGPEGQPGAPGPQLRPHPQRAASGKEVAGVEVHYRVRWPLPLEARFQICGFTALLGKAAWARPRS